MGGGAGAAWDWHHVQLRFVFVCGMVRTNQIVELVVVPHTKQQHKTRSRVLQDTGIECDIHQPLTRENALLTTLLLF